ncbi:transporter substrate-binding domain-containing protein [Faecalicatena contorta]|uniref:substrate-binding periplasmic protein n=1 Tax=Faecalicatena contorta TaxID=39482 RepID=UPI00196001D2|nr:transporter substrate-binding domain-containing protein [Faecalicatena contorta]MBM6685085.1 transporter substrate-binding domain-containing protein [Faecalicatena contorta]MBM6710613.1 transporter substrate-binding domain-containing protein [Faecalicatena contorta]
MKKRMVSIMLCLVMCTAAIAGCGGNTEESNTSETDASEAGDGGDTNTYGLDMDKIVVATSPGYEPFEYEEDGELMGYDVDIWKEFEERTGIEVEWEYTDFSGLLGLLQSGKADVVAAQMSPTEEREESFIFSDPVSYYGSTVVVAEDNDEIQSVEDLSGKVVGTGSGNNMQQIVEEMYPDGDVTFETYTSATLDAMLTDLVYGRIDAVLAQDIQTYMAMQANEELKVKVLDPFQYSEGCLVMDKSSTELADAVNAFLADLREDGTLSEISEKWIGEDISVEKE